MNRNRRRIGITINSLTSGGAEKQCLLLAKALKPYHNVVVFVLNPKPIHQAHLDFLTMEELDHIFISGNPFRTTLEFIRLLKKNKIDILFSFLPKDTILAAICGKIAKVPYVFGGIRNSQISPIKFVLLGLTHNTFLHATIANNFAALVSARRYGFKKRIMVIPNGIIIGSVPRKLPKDANTITIISLGRLVKQKAYETAIQSIALTKSNLPDHYNLNYKIVGDGPEKGKIIKTIRKYDLMDEIEVITDSADVFELLQSANIYLCTSIFEGLSNAVMEAMKCGLPVVATDVGDNSQLVIHGKSGFITSPGDSRIIAEHLYQLVNSPEIRVQMGSEGYEHLAKNFSYDTFKRNYMTVIQNVEYLQIHNGKLVANEVST